MAAVLNLAALAQRHKTVSCPSFPVTCGTEAWKVVHLHQPADNLVQSPVVNDVELFRLRILRLWFTVSAHTGLRAAADLGNAEMKDALSRLLALSCGNDHAGVRHRDSDTCHDLGRW